MSTKTSLMIFGIVAMSMALIAAASLTNLAIAATTDNNNNGKSKHDNGSGSSGSGSSGSGSSGSGTSPNDNQLSKKQLKEISNCVSDANKGPGGLSSKKVRDCYDQTVGLPTSTSGSTLPGVTNTNASSAK
ncbi:MAG: hypothetical protein WA395_03435 [Nitrososphaeraceae archaeon]